MGQPPIPRRAVIFTAFFFAAFFLQSFSYSFTYADTSATRPTTTVSTQVIAPRVASVTPAGTDILIGIGAANHLVAISYYDDIRQGLTKLPRVGDYDSIDWEKLAALHPQFLLTQHGDNRVQAGLEEHFAKLGIKVINLNIDVLQDIYNQTPIVAAAVGESAKADKAIATLKHELDAVRHRVAGKPPVKTLIISSDFGLDVVGPNTFLDELLTIAGGTNAAATLDKRYATVDREMLIALAPDVIIQLIPDGDKSPQLIARAKNSGPRSPSCPPSRAIVSLSSQTGMPSSQASA